MQDPRLQRTDEVLLQLRDLGARCGVADSLAAPATFAASSFEGAGGRFAGVLARGKLVLCSYM